MLNACVLGIGARRRFAGRELPNFAAEALAYPAQMSRDTAKTQGALWDG